MSELSRWESFLKFHPSPEPLPDQYCFYCGMKGLVRDPGPGDYYGGPEVACSHCQQVWSMPDLD